MSHMRHRSASNRPTVPAPNRGSRGSMIIYLVAALAVLGFISIAATGFFSSSQVGTARTNCAALARHLSESGIRYAESQVRAAADLATLTATATTLDSTTYTVDGAGTFDLTVSAPADNGGGVYEVSISSLGTACTADSPTQSTSNAGNVASNVSTGGGSSELGDINFEPNEDGTGGIGGFGESGEGGDDAGDAVNVNEDDQNITLGNGSNRSYGCAWYKGDESVCTGGVCEFGSGFRASFDIMLSSNIEGDGFVFTIANGHNNTVDDCGGDADQGELLAYAGPGNTGQGLEPPKIGLEFDIYPNTGTGNVDTSGSRNDDPASRDHVAWLFWGHSYWNLGASATYDDNRHGAGSWGGNNPEPPSADIPTSPDNAGESGAGDDGYYYDETRGGDWMREYNAGNTDKKFHIRVEVDRDETANADGNYCYTLKGWIVRDDVDLPDGIANVNEDYYDPDDETTWPQVQHMVVLSSSKHSLLDEIIFGWTTSTGAATQTITISNFHLTFKDEQTSCPAVTRPTDYVTAVPFYEGQSGYARNMVNGGGNGGWLNNGTWLKGKTCPGCASVLFDEDVSPAIYWDNKASSMTTAGTVSAWVYVKDYNDYMGIVRRGSRTNYNDEAFSLQFTVNNANFSSYGARYNEDDTGSGPGHGPGHGHGHGHGHGRIDGDTEPTFCVTENGSGQLYCVHSYHELEQDRWYHLAATWDGTADMMRFFVDGAQVAEYDIADAGYDLSKAREGYNVLLVGAQNEGHDTAFHGMIDDVYLYDRVLTDEEIAALYSDGLNANQE